ncbi:unnamed protein product [Medioppia subpectinata]|uniref:Uncharacterized protein n=1 Tax=Medioppia subpectinata TaxID=1979941 RepID=A0A7R9KI30_9ACAR|nr:unnamed protein product [Medioppia subpectinata]CAG2103706.1 unnamed protein product [Medioppia subpectinata]
MQTQRLLTRVEGLSNRFNDVIYKSPQHLTPNATNGHIVCYFGGDVQDLRHHMVDNTTGEDRSHLLAYCLESVTSIISDKFTASHVFAIRANRFHNKTYAVYDNFVVSDVFGSPKHEFSKQALTHLRLLLLNCFNQLDLNLDFKGDHKLAVIGFSKGCVVLNQLLYSFYVSLDDTELKDLISRIECMYWCDGGHSGSAQTWVTCQPVLNHFATLGIGVHINVSPYQVLCPFRPWVRLLLFYKKFSEDLLINESNIVYIKLFHAFNQNLNYESRALITINGLNNSPLIRQEPLSIESIAALKQSSSEGSNYYLKAVAIKSLENENSVKSSTTFISACSLYESSLSDILVVTLDPNGQFLSLSASTLNPQCVSSVKSSLATKLTNFNTTVVVMPTVVSNGYI